MCDNSAKHTSENGDGMEKEELLQRVFGYSSFRSGQEKLIAAVRGIDRAERFPDVRSLTRD